MCQEVCERKLTLEVLVKDKIFNLKKLKFWRWLVYKPKQVTLRCKHIVYDCGVKTYAPLPTLYTFKS